MGHETDGDMDLTQPRTAQSIETLPDMEMQSTTRLASSQDPELLKPCGGIVGAWVKNARLRLLYLPRSLDKNIANKIKQVLLISAITAYVIYVLVRWRYSECGNIGWSNGYGLFFVICILIAVFVIYHGLIRPQSGNIWNNSSYNVQRKLKNAVRRAYWCLLGLGVLVFLILSAIDAMDEPRRFLSLFGYFLLLFIAFIFSKHPDYVRWDIVARGISLHMLMAFVIVKWDTGRSVLSVFSQKIIEFLEFAYVGARFVYGDMLIDLGIFIFKSLSVLFFLAMVINVLFYYGVLQRLFRSLGVMMQVLIGTTIIESSNSVATVFLGMSESPLLFKPYLAELTTSEIHAIMSSGFATVAGTVLAAYVAYGADPATLVSASAMAAPASLILAKLFYPETRPTKTSFKNFVLYKSEDANAVDAACKGAILGCELVPAIAANVLSFVSLVACFNALLTWLGQLAGIPNLSFERVVGLFFVPLSWAMGVEPSQIFNVGRLIGIKTAINEFIGYKELGILKRANKLSPRSEAIATYAMCGFANPGAVAILASSLITICPAKSSIITGVAFRAFVSGSFASFLSASLAGFLTPENGFDSSFYVDNHNNDSMSNNTSCYFYSW